MTPICPLTHRPHDTYLNVYDSKFHCVHCGAKCRAPKREPQLAKHRVTYIHPISNPRDTADQIPAAVELLDVDALMAAYNVASLEGLWGVKAARRRAVAAFLRKAGILPSGVRARDVRLEDGCLVIITAIVGLHAVRIDLTPCYDALTADRPVRRGAEEQA